MIKYVGKILLCALSAVVGTMIGGMIPTALQLAQPKLPGQADIRPLFVYMVIAGVALSIAMAELARRLNGNRRVRFAAVAWFAYAWLGINNPVEGSIFTTMGGEPAVAVTMLLPCLFLAGAVTLLFGHTRMGSSFSANFVPFERHRTAVQWVIRLLIAIAAFPAVYLFFGMPVGLMVGKFYQDQAFGLQLPSLGVIIGVQFFRSLVTLLAALPILAFWAASRRQFAWTFGLSLFVLSGLYGLIQAYWMPWALRGIHTVELLLDSLAYSWILAFVFMPAASERQFQSAEKLAAGTIESTAQIRKETI